MASFNGKMESAIALNRPQIEKNSDQAEFDTAFNATNPAFGVNQKAMNTALGGMGGEGLNQPAPMFNPVEFLNDLAKPKNDEVSLKTLKPKEKEKILKAFQRCRDIAKSHYEKIVEPAIIKRRKIYDASEEYYEEVMPYLSQQSKWTSKDVQTVIEWIMPSLIDVFTGSDDPVSIRGVNIEDDGIAEKVQQLIRYELERKNDYFPFVHDIVKTALAENFAVAKVWWKRDEDHKPMKMLLDINDQEQVLLLIMAATTGKIAITRFKQLPEAPDLFNVEYDELKLLANHPVIEFVPSSELRYTPDASVIHDCKFVAHRKVVTGDYLKRRERDGIYEGIDKALEEYGTGDTTETTLDKKNDGDRFDKNNKAYDHDIASKEVELYEAYMQVDYNNDGIYENLIVHAVGNHLIRVAENDSKLPPFFICSAVYDPNAVFNKHSFSESFKNIQDIKTAVVRQIIINVAKNNSPRLFVNERTTNMDALMANEEIIPIQGNPTENIMATPQLPLSSVTMELVSYMQNELEALSGSTRYNQGLDSQSLNKTASGLQSIMSSADKRIKLLARTIAERFFIPIYKYLILLNQKYLDDEQLVRLTNENFSIRREELDLDYDLIVNVGQGAGTKEGQIQYLMGVLTQIYPAIGQQGVVNAKNYYNISVKLLEALGLRDVGQYLLDPESPEAQQAAIAAQQAQAQAQTEALQNSLQLSIAKQSVPRISLDMTKMPPDAQVQYLAQKLGIQTTEEAIVEHERMEGDYDNGTQDS